MKPGLGRALIGAVAVLVLAEGAAAWWHLQRSPERGSAIGWLASRAWAKFEASREQRRILAELKGVSPERYEAAVFAAAPSPEAAAVRAELEARYREALLGIAAMARARGARLVLFYPPIVTPGNGRGRSVFETLTAELNLPLVVPARVSEWPAEVAFLVPHDIHPSRFGHRLMAEALVGQLRALALHRASPLAPGPAPERLGEQPSGQDEILRTVAEYPVRLGTNAQGLRMQERVPRNADRQVILVLGDSFTFGTASARSDAYPGQLARMLPGALIANAGVGGYGILDSARIYDRFWRDARADIVVLQVLDNDVEDLLWYSPSNWQRSATPRPPSPAELRLRDRLAEAPGGGL